jgi:hypothetical protein
MGIVLVSVSYYPAESIEIIRGGFHAESSFDHLRGDRSDSKVHLRQEPRCHTGYDPTSFPMFTRYDRETDRGVLIKVEYGSQAIREWSGECCRSR